MRGLASALDFEVMSLYNHVSNKADLLAGMVDGVAREIELPTSKMPWRHALRRSCISAHDALDRHRWASALWSSTIPGPVRISVMESWLQTLHTSGLDEHSAHRGFHAVSNHVVGYALQESSGLAMDSPDSLARARSFLAGLDRSAHPRVVEHVQHHLDGDPAGGSFRFVLDLILDGLSSTHERESRPITGRDDRTQRRVSRG
ncbi:MAG: TetR/AcrR family transcriptional regulator C-terminal domain-containing protein [Ornithinimicrobium sp.]